MEPAENFRLLFEQGPLGMTITGRDYRLIEVNDAFCRMVGRSPGEVVGHHCDELTHPDDRAEEHRFAEHLFAGDANTFQMDKRFVRPDGRIVWARMTGALIRGDSGEVHYAVSMFEDITAQRAAELEVSMAHERLRQMADAMPMVVWIADPDGTMNYLNARARQLVGPMNELTLTEIATVVHPDDLANVTETWKQRVPAGQEFDLELRLRDANSGDYRWYLLRVVPGRNDQGLLMHWYGSAVDIHLHKVALTQANEASAAKDYFLATLSHELRTPLTPALAAATVLEMDDHLPLELQEDARIIRQSIETEKRLIDDLLDLTRVSAGKLEMQFASVDLCSVARNAVATCVIDAEAKGVRLVLRPCDQLVAKGDASRLQQVLWNLLNNSIKFTPSGGTITLSATADGEVARLSVSDTGMGMEPDVLERVFGAFEQVDRNVTRRYGGLGLGLSICRTIVTQHGGRIWATSDGRGQGSTFWVELPLLVGGQIEPKGEPERPAEMSEAQSLSILLVEDHADTARMLAQLLRRYGHSVVIAGDLATARAAAESSQFSLLISDLGLPDGSGLDLMRELGPAKALRGIALSGYGMEEDIRRSLDAGFDEHIVKPVNIGPLAKALRRVVALGPRQGGTAKQGAAAVDAAPRSPQLSDRKSA